MSNEGLTLIGTCDGCKWWKRLWSEGIDGHCEKSIRVVFGDPEAGFGCIKWEMKEDA